MCSSAWRVLAAVTVLTLGAAAAREDPRPHRFQIRIAGGQISGSEEYSIARGDAGYRLAGSVRIDRRGVTIASTHELTLGENLDLRRYLLEADVGAQKQRIEAERKNDSVVMRVTAAGGTRERTVPHRPNSVLLDNVVPSHFQVLLDRIDRDPVMPDDVWLIVPQALSDSLGRLKQEGEEQGSFEGRALILRKHTLTVGALLVEIWSDVRDRRLMRVAIPLQQAEMTREGFLPAAASQPAEPRPGERVERAVVVPSGAWKLPATLCLPADGAGPFPAMVFVHGSGPHDRDETIGPNKPFRDLAHGLAARGIASLRYEKRTFAHRTAIPVDTMTLEEEVIEDAAAALAWVSRQEEIRKGRVYLLGHSLGASMAPYVVARFPDVGGAVLLAALVRRPEEAIVDQVAREAGIRGQSREDVAQATGQIEAALARIRSGEAKDSERVLGASARYWRDWMRRDVLGAIRKMTVPVLILQGGKDYQVTTEDYRRIEQALESTAGSRWEARLFPDLNHLFMQVEGTSTGAEYGRPGHVAEEVIETIARWIEATAR